MDLRKLKTLIDLVSESNIAELEITEAEGKVRIVKSGGGGALQPMTLHPSAFAQQAMTSPVSAMPAPAAAGDGAHDAAAPEAKEGLVKSPMVGTFYRASSPGGKPLVDIGSVVKEGDPLCIIEAMKIMNEIEADRAGTVQKVLCENGQAVEFGQPLFVIA
jgi:acetyl-CoA carboxylase biotin carboxyl carrier protein